MKTTDQIVYSSWLIASTMLVFLPTFTVVAIEQDETTSAPGDTVKGEQSKQEDSNSWTCAMHPQVHSSKSGACPICNMKLIPGGKGESRPVLSLDQMLVQALKYNPEIRAAQARVIAAEAELDQTRLGVLQKLSAYREKWQIQRASVAAAEKELANVQRSANNADLSDQQRLNVARLLTSSLDNLRFVQAQLTELEAELPYLIGEPGMNRLTVTSDDNLKPIKETLVPMLEQLVKLTVEDYRAGNAELSDLLQWSRRLAEHKIRIAETKKERVVIVQSYMELATGIAEITEARYANGTSRLRDALASRIAVSEAELWLRDLRD